MKQRWLGFFLLAISALASAQKPAPPVDVVITDAKSGLVIIIEKDGKFNSELAPWSNFKPKAEPLDEKEGERAVKMYKKAIAKYPPAMLKNWLTKVYLTKQLTVADYPYGGTYYGKTLFLSDQGEDAGYTDDYLESTFHHEFSSLLKTDPKANFPEKEWDGLRPDGFKYIGYDPVFKNDGTDWFVESEKLFADGFVDKYATVAVEEDLNEVASRLFSGGARFWRNVDKYPKLANKVRLAISFYGGLDPTFTEAYFRGLARAK